jgi:hypothetical protein
MKKFPYINELLRFCDPLFENDEVPRIDDVVSGGVGGKLRFLGSGSDEFDVESLRTVIKQTIERDGKKPNTDFFLSVELHKVLSGFGMNRKIASKIDVWDFLTVFHYSDYVKWRWSNPPKTRYCGGNMGDNSLARLWWWAEMTIDESRDDPYELTSETKLLQETLNFTLDTIMPRNKNILLSILTYIIDNELNDEEIKTLFRMARALNATRKIEFVNKDDIIESFDTFLR